MDTNTRALAEREELVRDLERQFRPEYVPALPEAKAAKVPEPGLAAPNTREQWLMGALEALRPVMERNGYALPASIRVSCGFPGSKGLARTKRRVGECWYGDSSADGALNVFVSPLIADTAEVLGILVHELGHCALGRKVAHKGRFIGFCKALHLEGKPTATTISEPFKRLMLPLVASLGKYPHAALLHVDRERKQGTRMLKCVCGACGYTVRTTQKWLDVGAPICPEDELPMTAKSP